MKLERFVFLCAAGIAIFGALIHWIAPLIGAEWYSFLTAPAWVVESARNGTWDAPIGGAVIGGLMMLCGLYAFSATGLIRRLPFSRTALCVITTICLVRGLLLIPFLIKVPQRLSAFDITASVVWFVAGLCFLVGTILCWKKLMIFSKK